jgi:hypothetical protein
VKRRASDALWPWIAATLLSGLPSTLYALFSGGEVLEATRAAGAMLIPARSSLLQLFAAAAFVQGTVSFFWVLILALVLPRRRVFLWAVIASALIGLLHLLVIAPLLFLGAAFYWRSERRASAGRA